MTFYDMTWLERLLFLKRIKGGSGHEETTTSNTFVTDMVAPLRKLLLSFAPKQSGSGDPSPDNIRPISGWDGVSVVRSGVNLFDGEWESGSINSSGQPVSGGSNIRPKHKIFVLPSKTYAISHSSGSRNIYWYTYKADGSFSRYIGLKNTSSSTLATNADEYYLWCYQYNNTSAPTDMQVEISPKTDYEPYAGQAYSVSFPALGKNLLNPNDPDWGNYTIGPNGEEVTSSADRITSGFIPCNAGDSFVVNTRNTNGNYKWAFVGFAFYNESKEFISRAYVNSTTQTFSAQVPSGAVYMRMFEQIKNVTVTSPSVFATYEQQLELGSTATAYEPYKSVYGGTLDMVSGVLTVTHRLKTPNGVGTYNNGESVRKSGVAGTNSYYFAPDYTVKDVGEDVMKCNAFKYVPTVDVASSTPNTAFYATHQLRFSLPTDSELNTVEKVNTWMNTLYVNGTPLQFAEILVTPQTYQLTPQQINTLIGTNVITTDANVEEIIYLKKAE